MARYNSSYLILLSLLFLLSCNSSDESTATEMTEISGEHSGHTHLTTAQQELAGIELGPAEQRSVANTIGCTAHVDVPPYSLASVYTPIAGIVQSVQHLPGEYVRKGTVLTRIQHPDIVEVQADFVESHSQLTFLKQDAERKVTLAAADAASARSAEEAQAALAQQEAHLQGLRAQLRLLGIDADALAESGDIRTSITLRAPISGHLTEVNLNQGQLVSTDDLLYEIIDNTHKHLELSVFTKDLPLLKEDQRIEAYIPGSDQRYEAEIHLIGSRVDAESKSVQVHGHFVNEPKDLLPGTYLQARIFTNEQLAWVVPETAVIQQGEEAYLFAQEGDGFVSIPVDIASTRDSFMVIRNADQIKDKTLVLRGAYYLKEGVEVGHTH